MAGWLRAHVTGVMLRIVFTLAGLIWRAGEMVEHS
jgi:hypothetical protein